MPPQRMDLIFPLRGIDDGWAFGRQPEGSCPDASNVVPFDPISSRARGGQRWGTSKVFAAQHNGSNALQRITSMASAQTTSDITTSTVAVSGPLWTTYSGIPATFTPGYMFTGKGYTFSSGYHIKITNTMQDGASIYYFGVMLRVNPAENDEFYALRFAVQDLGAGAILSGTLYKSTTSGVETIDSDQTPNSALVNDALLTGLILDINVTAAGLVFVTLPNVSPDLQLDFNPAMSSFGDYDLIGAAFSDNWEGGGEQSFSDFTITGADLSQSGRTFDLVAVSGGDIYAGPIDGVLDLATSGTNAVNTTGRVDAQPFLGKVYFVDGDPAHYKLWTQSTDTVSTLTPTAGTLPIGSTETAVSITAVDAGNKKFTVAEDWSDRVAGDYFLVAGSTGNDGYYTLVSLTGSGPTVLTVTETVPDGTVDGTIQYQDQGCRMVKSYRGRLIMAGLYTDPQNWFMSAVDSPLDWNYGATVSATMAVAGNQTDTGKCPDIITCLAPFSDDLLVIGGDHTIWVMRGDPADRGRIDKISDQTGIAGPDSYAYDPNGIIYFFGSGTVWRMVMDGAPEPLSRNRMDEAFRAINLTTNTVHLAWDNVRHGVHIFVVPRVEGATTHYFWDERTDGFWKVAFPDAQGPTTAFSFNGDDPDDNALMLGGWDGYIRQIDSSATDDDGTAISSYVLYPPISAGGPMNNTRLNQITAVLDTNSDDVLLTAYAEDTVQKAVESSTIRFVRTLTAPRTKIIARVAGNSIMLKLSNSTDETTWSIEHLIADVEVVGHTRKNQL